MDYIAGNYSNLQAGILRTCNDVSLLILQMCSPALLGCQLEGILEVCFKITVLLYHCSKV